jgi:hypothetical protein
MTDVQESNHEHAVTALIDLIARLIAREHYRNTAQPTLGQHLRPDDESDAGNPTDNKEAPCRDR